MNNLHNDMKELYKAVENDIMELGAYIFDNEDNSDYSVQNIISIKRTQLQAMLDLRDALDKALWERYDDNNMDYMF